MFEKEPQRTLEKPSINFADSIAAPKKAPQGKTPPEYQMGSTSQNSAKGTSKTGAEKEENQTQGSGQLMTLYVHGFIPERDALGNKNRNENGERIEQDDYNGYWADIDDKFEERFTGKAPQTANTVYFDGSAGALSSAQDRYEYGLAAAQLFYEQNKENLVNGKFDKPLNIVSHSMGGAYAAGLARGLLDIKNGGENVFDIRCSYYLAPHQPMDFTHPSEIRGVQYSHENDAVSSRGFIPWGSGSKMGPINGISEYLVHDKPGVNRKMFGKDAQRGGHNVDEHDYIFDMYDIGEEGYVSSNSDTEYDNYQDVGPTPEKEKDRTFHLPKIIDFIEDLPEWASEKVDQGKEWIGEKWETGKSWLKNTGAQAKRKIGKAFSKLKKKAKNLGKKGLKTLKKVGRWFKSLF